MLPRALGEEARGDVWYDSIMKHALAELFASTLRQLGVPNPEVLVTVPEDPAHGDYTTNVAMKIAKTMKKPPMEIALQVKKRMENGEWRVESKARDQKRSKHGQTKSAKLAQLDPLQAIDRIEVAPPGFINIFLTEASLITQIERLLKSVETARTPQEFLGRWAAGSGHSRRMRVMVEFAHPNTHKAFHIGHLRNITTGESIVRLLESQGHTVIRANYQGDVGLHIAKCLYGMVRISHFPFPISNLKTASERVEFLGRAYAAGSKAYEEDPAAKAEIEEMNRKIYAKDPSVLPLYRQTRQWSLDYFDKIYKRVGSRFDRLYFESEVYERGKALVMEGLAKGIFEESDGAIIFPGARYGLHNRVFVTAEGNPTYEGKELALAMLETTEFGALDRIIHVVGPEQAGFFQVTFKTQELLGIVKPGVQRHLIYGWVKLKHGKMSSRSGNVVLGEWLLDEAKKAIYDILQKNKSNYTKEEQETIAEKAAIAAVKYAFLKVSTTSEIAFDLKTSVSFEGDSGPYLQYTYARCRSVLRKASDGNVPQPPLARRGGEWGGTLNPEERSLARLLTQFPDVVAEAAETFAPSALCAYLFRLAQTFNLFYAKHEILGVPLRLALTAATASVIRQGLHLLGIDTLERM